MGNKICMEFRGNRPVLLVPFIWLESHTQNNVANKDINLNQIYMLHHLIIFLRQAAC
jgi:hypothetical protein